MPSVAEAGAVVQAAAAKEVGDTETATVRGDDAVTVVAGSMEPQTIYQPDREPQLVSEAAEESVKEYTVGTQPSDSDETEERYTQAEESPQEYAQPVSGEAAEEEFLQQPSMEAIMAEAAITTEPDNLDGRTIEIPVEEVRAGLGGMTIDLQKALESAVTEPESPYSLKTLQSPTSQRMNICIRLPRISVCPQRRPCLRREQPRHPF
ncbi:MAG: hypothetical protein ACLRMZ_23500 [Blautia marasmi]